MGERHGKLGTFDGAALVVSTVIGAGIFTVPSLIASLTGIASGFVTVWIAGGLLAIAGALSYAELASRFPDAGGEYVYLREAFGPVAGFLSGWTSFIAGFSGAIAASAVGFAQYLAPIWPSVGGPPLARFGAGGDCLGTRRIRHPGEQGRCHLRAAGVVDASKDHAVH